MTRVAFFVGLVLWSVPAHAQWIVVDPLNVAQAVLIAERTLKVYATVMQQYHTLQTMAARLPGGMDRYHTPPIVPSSHDVARYPYGAALLNALNNGDPRGELYEQIVQALPAVASLVLDQLPPATRRAMRNQYGTIQVADSIIERAIHQRALVSGFSGGEMAQAIQALEQDVTEPRTAYHYLTAILDKLTGGALIAGRQDTAMNQLLSHQLELLILKGKRQRDTEAAVMSMRLTGMQYGAQAQAAIIAGAANDLRTWRQP